MRTLNIRVDYSDPAKELESKLKGDRNIKNLRINRRSDGSIDVSYNLKADDPYNEILAYLKNLTKNTVSGSKSYYGASFTIRIDDKLDEKAFKKDLSESLRKMGYKMS